VKLVELEKVSWACPSAWKGKTDKCEEFYARFRWGKLSAKINNITFYENLIDEEGYNGFMETDEMVKLLELEVEQELIDKNMTDWVQISKNVDSFIEWYEKLENKKLE